MAHCEKANRDGGYTFLSMLLVLSISMLMVASLWTMVMKRTALAKVVATSSNTLQMTYTVSDTQIVMLEELVATNQGLIANGIQPYLEAEATAVPSVIKSREARLLTKAVAYQYLVASYTKATIYGPVFGTKDAPTQVYTYEADANQEGQSTKCTTKVLFRESLKGKKESTLEKYKLDMTDYGKVRDRLLSIQGELAKGKSLSELQSSFDTLEKELDDKAQFYIYTNSETKEVAVDGKEKTYDRQTGYQLMHIEVSDDFELQVSDLGSVIVAGEIGLQKGALALERVP